MPESKADKKWRLARNKEIRKRRRQGDSIKALMHEYGLCESSIYGILRAR